MDLVTIVTVLAIGQFIWFGIQVGSIRGKHEVKAPAMSEHPDFERAFRVHMNTLEQLICFLPIAVMLVWVFVVAVMKLI